MSKHGSAEPDPPALPPWLTGHGDDTLVDVLVVPRASLTKTAGEYDGRLRVRVAAPPVDGAANTALLIHLARQCGLPAGAATLESGMTSRRKRVRLVGVRPASVVARLR